MPDNDQDAIEFTYEHTTYRSIMVAGADLRSLAKATGLSKKALVALADDEVLLDEEEIEDENRVAAIRAWLEENENRLAETTDEDQFGDLKAH